MSADEDEENLVYIDLAGQKINTSSDIPIDNEIISCEDSLLANLYSTVEFLKKQIEEKDFLIRTLLLKDGESYSVMYPEVSRSNYKFQIDSMETSSEKTSNDDSYRTLDDTFQTLSEATIDTLENSEISQAESIEFNYERQVTNDSQMNTSGNNVIKNNTVNDIVIENSTNEELLSSEI